MTLIWLCGAFIAGIVVGDALGGPPLPWMTAGVMAAALAWLWRGSQARLALLVVSVFALGGARDAAARPRMDANAVWLYAGKPVVFVGTIARQVDWRDDGQVVVVAAERLRANIGWRSTYGLVRLRVKPAPALRYGQQIEVRGRLLRAEAGPSPDFGAYLQRHGIYAVVDRPQIKVVGVPRERGALGVLLALNDGLRAVMLRLLPEPHAALLAGMILGTQSAIPPEVLADFRATGTSHLLVISGWNITVLVGGVVGVLLALGLPRRHAALLSLPVLMVYVLFVGASPSVLRAGIMGGLVIWAEWADREPDAWTGLLLACAALASIDPDVLWDTGFQLSALATAGILAWAKPLARRLRQAPLLGGERMAGPVETVATTLAALVLTLPILLYAFGTLALVAPLANVLLAPAVPLAMLFGALGAVVGMLYLPLGQLLALLAWPFTAWLLTGTHLLARLPAAAVQVAPFSGWWLWAWYGGLAGLMLLKARQGIRLTKVGA